MLSIRLSTMCAVIIKTEILSHHGIQESVHFLTCQKLIFKIIWHLIGKINIIIFPFLHFVCSVVKGNSIIPT